MVADIILAIASPAFPAGGHPWLPYGLDSLLAGRWLVILLMTTVLLLLIAPRSSLRPIEIARELMIVIPAVIVYDIVRGLVAGRESEAVERATRIIELEQSVRIFWELDVQHYILDYQPLVNLMNLTYLLGFWPVLVLAAIWLFFQRREAYPLYRNAFFISGAIGLVIYALLPVAPPRFVDGWGFVDTVARGTNAYAMPDAPLIVNQYAAMPSLHFGWVLLVGIAVVQQSSGIWPKLLGVFMPVAMFASIITTGNHFILDGVAGAAVALIGLGAAYVLHRAVGSGPVLSDEPVPVFASRLF